MERCLASIITRHSSRFYIGPRNGVRYLSSSAPFYNQVKTPPVKNKAQPKATKKAKAIVREVARQIALAKANREANDSRENALLKDLSKLQFCGDIIVELSPSDAIATAMEMSSGSFADRQHMVFFVDGSRVWKPKDRSQSSITGNKSELIAHLGAAVVYKSFEGGEGWQERYFALPNEQSSTLAELFAIAQGLAVATEEIMVLRSQDGVNHGRMTTNYRVIIFSDSQSALAQVKKLREEGVVANSQMFKDPIIRKIMTRSQYLHRIGVHHELRWVVGHSKKVIGHIRADAAAQQAAKTQDISVRIDEGLRLIELEAASKMTNKQPPSSKRPQKERLVKKQNEGNDTS
ncbi:hypothetical protein GGI43DRAFT_283029 [Trichoderma evansii]